MYGFVTGCIGFVFLLLSETSTAPQIHKVDRVDQAVEVTAMPLHIDAIPAGGYRLIFEEEYLLEEALMALDTLQAQLAPATRLPTELDFTESYTVLEEAELEQLGQALGKLSDNIQIFVADVASFGMARVLGRICETSGAKVDISYRA